MNNYFFGPLLCQTKVDNHIIDKLLIEGNKKLKDHSENLAGHLQSQFEYDKETMRWFYDETLPIFKTFYENTAKFHGQERHLNGFNYSSLWINFMKAGDFNPPHIHGGEYSFVVFLDVPEKLSEEEKKFKGTTFRPATVNFQYGEFHEKRNQNSLPFVVDAHSFLPQKGDMFLFPALLQHWVAPFKSDVTRISVSGNIFIFNKE